MHDPALCGLGHPASCLRGVTRGNRELRDRASCIQKSDAGRSATATLDSDQAHSSEAGQGLVERVRGDAVGSKASRLHDEAGGAAGTSMSPQNQPHRQGLSRQLGCGAQPPGRNADWLLAKQAKSRLRGGQHHGALSAVIISLFRQSARTSQPHTKATPLRAPA